MKVYKTTVQPSVQALYVALSKQLNPLFQDKIQKDVNLRVTHNENVIEIGQPDLYQTFLYQIVVDGADIRVIKSEHYVDDVYSLALDDLISGIIAGYVGPNNIEYIEQ